jgi:hypothetical protein
MSADWQSALARLYESCRRKRRDLKAINFVAPWLHNPEIARGIYGGKNARKPNREIEGAKKKFAETGR